MSDNKDGKSKGTKADELLKGKKSAELSEKDLDKVTGGVAPVKNSPHGIKGTTGNH